MGAVASQLTQVPPCMSPLQAAIRACVQDEESAPSAFVYHLLRDAHTTDVLATRFIKFVEAQGIHHYSIGTPHPINTWTYSGRGSPATCRALTAFQRWINNTAAQ